MAYGDATLDEIMAQLRASEGAPRPQFRITQASSVLPNVAQAPVAPAATAAPVATPALPRAERFGRGVAKFIRGFGGKSVGALATGNVLAEGLLGETSVPNAIRTGVGIGGILNPAVGVPLATGMTAASLIPDAAYDAALGTTPKDLRGPATMEFLRRGGVTTAAPVVAPAPAPAATVGPAEAQAPVLMPEPLASPGNLIVPPRGTGFIRNNTTGATQYLDARVSPEFIAAQTPAGPRAPRGFTEALLNLKQVSGDNALKAAQAKAASAALAARGTAARGAAALQTSNLSARLAAEHLRANPGDLAGASAILHGRAEGGGDQVFFPGLGPNDPVLVGNKRTGGAVLKRPKVEAQMGKDAKGVWQILGPDGKAVRPATPDEIAQRNVGR